MKQAFKQTRYKLELNFYYLNFEKLSGCLDSLRQVGNPDCAGQRHHKKSQDFRLSRGTQNLEPTHQVTTLFITDLLSYHYLFLRGEIHFDMGNFITKISKT